MSDGMPLPIYKQEGVSHLEPFELRMAFKKKNPPIQLQEPCLDLAR